ncbi:1,6-anhydro-N-acetylmuramyl-L-alanine amidase AmpD [Echinimonas agarilytica]|uniref:1,6-anhydro-N-acetylmuramyl-L-alanine amidase AmpD n=1 Tax=Echinimonas agarilytica TaxID=1215918 RepID=A0AA41W4V4_9GAMM|nr:1,6-anhydro-N-acetylmuramyl-L-alanine amidase AmpD [Echinimonas agarilytica]MCM2678798.1 1,6-anhydro-N-acetylmuramyl-L-alanine amidase AmpD [Echinimonas agarilytica]
MQLDQEYRLRDVVQRPSPHFDARPLGTEPNLLVIHNISLPPGCFDGDDIDHLFMGTLDCASHDFYHELVNVRVSAHCVIRRDGSIRQYVPFNLRAWHAGSSSFQGKTACNDFSIGIELEGTDQSGFTSDQYQRLIAVTRTLMDCYPGITLGSIVGHSDIAHGRKTDPGFGFDWCMFRTLLTDTD